MIRYRTAFPIESHLDLKNMHSANTFPILSGPSQLLWLEDMAYTLLYNRKFSVYFESSESLGFLCLMLSFIKWIVEWHSGDRSRLQNICKLGSNVKARNS